MYSVSLCISMSADFSSTTPPAASPAVEVVAHCLPGDSRRRRRDRHQPGVFRIVALLVASLSRRPCQTLLTLVGPPFGRRFDRNDVAERRARGSSAMSESWGGPSAAMTRRGPALDLRRP